MGPTIGLGFTYMFSVLLGSMCIDCSDSKGLVIGTREHIGECLVYKG